MRRCCYVLLVSWCCLAALSCSRNKVEDPFTYPFVKEIHIKPAPDKPYGNYKALYLLTEDLEPYLTSPAQIDEAREALGFAADLSTKNSVPWTHFVDISAFEPAFVSGDDAAKSGCRALLGDLKGMVEKGDDAELHLHGPMSGRFIDVLRAEEKHSVRVKSIEDAVSYRQRKSFFFNSFYRGGYREIVLSLTYGKYALERYLYDGKEQVLAFRPGGWDQGGTEQDALIYFSALSASGLVANSGVAVGNFGGPDWRVGSDPGHNVASIQVGEKEIIEVSPTRGPGGYITPVLPNDLLKLSNAVRNEIPVIVAVYHLAASEVKSRTG